jgi:3'(2'), 5'-bisphosphate nucleotidase
VKRRAMMTRKPRFPQARQNKGPLPSRNAMLDHRQLLAALLEPVLQAGAVEMRYYKSGVRVEMKGDSSPVTAADQEAEIILIKALEAAAPAIPIVAEESVAAGRLPELQDRFFLVDPLDGTREFINQRDEFTVNIALVEQGIPRFGIVYVPALGDLYVTLAANRAARVCIHPDAAGSAAHNDIAWTQIHARQPDLTALTAVASRSHNTPETEAFLARYRIAQRSNAGSSLKFCVIARGDADIYPRHGPTMAWDTAAGHAVLLAAGGSVTDLAGMPLLYGERREGKPLDRLRNPHFVAWGAAGTIPTT